MPETLPAGVPELTLTDTIYGLFFESADAGDGDGTYQEFVDAPGFTADQLHAAHAEGARAGYLAGLEAAALACGSVWINCNTGHEAMVADECAAAIRELKGQK